MKANGKELKECRASSFGDVATSRPKKEADS